MYWSWCDAVKGPPQRETAFEVPRFLRMATEKPMDKEKPTAKRAQAVRERRTARNAEYARATSVGGKDHPFYRRKEAFSRTPNKRPTLNTCDCAEAYALPQQMIAAAQLAAQAEAEAEAVYHRMRAALGDSQQLLEAEAPDAAPNHAPDAATLGEFGRFVVDRRPRREASGAWVIVPPPTDTREDALCCSVPSTLSAAALADDELLTLAGDDDALADDVMSLASFSEEMSDEVSEQAADAGSAAVVTADALAWPALPSPLAAATGVAPPRAHLLRAWAGAAPATTAAVDDDADGSEDSFELLSAPALGGAGAPPADKVAATDLPVPPTAVPAAAPAAWRDAAATKAAVGLPCASGSPSAGSPMAAERARLRSGASLRASAPAAGPRRVPRAAAPSEDDELFDGVWLQEGRQPRDAHRGASLSVKARERVQTALARREAQREAQREVRRSRSSEEL